MSQNPNVYDPNQARLSFYRPIAESNIKDLEDLALELQGKSRLVELMHADSLQLFKRMDGNNAYDILFRIAMNTVYAHILCGRIKAHSSESSFYVPNDHGWESEYLLPLIDKNYVAGFKEAPTKYPKDILNKAEELYPLWFKLRFGGQYKYSPEYMDVLQNPKPAIVPMDHKEPKRSFMGRVAGYPKEGERRAFQYMKAWGFPPIFYYGKPNGPNDYGGYINSRASDMNESPATTLRRSGWHEGTHVNIVDPAIEIILGGALAHSWLSEGLTRSAEELKLEFRFQSIRKPIAIREIINTDSLPVNYEMSHFVVSKLDKRMSGNGNGHNVLRRLMEVAENVKNTQIPSTHKHANLLSLLDPSLENLTQLERFEREMNLSLN